VIRARMVFSILCPALWCAGQVAVPVPAQPSPQTPAQRIVAHGVFPVKITRTLDSGRLSKGDPIEAVTDGSFRLPDGKLVLKGSKLAGHVIAATARSKGDAQSELGIVFDHVSVQKDGDLRIKTMVQAAYPPLEEQDPGAVNGYTMAASGGPGYLPPDIKSGSNPDAPVKAQPVLDLKFVGVQGMKDLELKKGGLLWSPEGRNVKLGKGVRLVVRAIILG